MRKKWIKKCDAQLSIKMFLEDKMLLAFLAKKHGESLGRYILCSALHWARTYNRDLCREFDELINQQQ